MGDREPRTKPQQWEIIVDYLEANPELITKKFGGYNDAVTVQDKWNSLTNTLNSMGCGFKSVQKWQLAISRWKSKAKAKAAAIRREANATGGGPKTAPPLTDLEERLMSIVGWKAVEGDGNIELGFGNSTTTCSTSVVQSAKIVSPPSLQLISEAIPLSSLCRPPPSLPSVAPPPSPVAPPPSPSVAPPPSPSVAPLPSPSVSSACSSAAATTTNPVMPATPNKKRRGSDKPQQVKTRRRIATSTHHTRRFTSMAQMHQESMQVLKNIDKTLKELVEQNRSMVASQSQLAASIEKYVNYVVQRDETYLSAFKKIII